MKIEFHPESVEDLLHAIEYYDAVRDGLGEELRSEVDAGLERLRLQPEMCRRVSGEIRRYALRRFPFSILYRVIDSDRMRVLMIRHHRREPNCGAERA